MSERGKATCANCGYTGYVTCPFGITPTPTIVREVCDRDPCPRCGTTTMEPDRPDPGGERG